MSQRTSRHVRLQAVLVALIIGGPAAFMMFPPVTAAPSLAEVSELSTGYLMDGGLDTTGLPRLADPTVGLDIDDPGPPFGYPNDNTLGYVTNDANLDRWKRDTEGPFTINVDMGKLIEKKDISGTTDYILELSFSMVGYYWYDNDGSFDPVTGAHTGLGDDPCPNEPFPLFTVTVNGQEIRTAEGHKTTFCTPGDPEVGRTFEIKSEGDDPPYWFRIPKDVLREGNNAVRFEVHDFELPAYQRYHSKFSDGWLMYIDTVMIELAAPPLVLSHGWSNAWDAGSGTVAWQPTLRSNIKSEATAHFGQNIWRWAAVDKGGKEPILLNSYNKKQDFRKSGSELKTTVANHHNDLGFSGKAWLHGHSMGGLVGRHYLESLGGNAKIDRFAQDGTPNLGSWEANAYTGWHRWDYDELDGDLLAKYIWVPKLLGFGFRKQFIGFKDWWKPTVGAFATAPGAAIGRDHLADFEIKPESSNPILRNQNARFPASGVAYFVVRGDCNVFTHYTCAASQRFWRGDGVVSLGSASMDGRIAHRDVDAAHEMIPEQIETSRFMIRFYTELDLDSGRPSSAPGNGAGVPDPFMPAAAAPEAYTDHPGNVIGETVATLITDDENGDVFERGFTIGDVASADVSVSLALDAPTVTVTLTTPSGVALTEESGAGVAYSLTNTALARVHGFALANPEAGVWTVRVDADQPPAGEGFSVVARAFDDTPLRLAAGAGADRYKPGETATLTAALTSTGAAVTGATVTATGRNAVGDPVTLTLRDDGASGDGAAGDGVYAAAWTVPEEGTYAFAIHADTALGVRGADIELVVAAYPDVTVSSVVGGPAGTWAGDPVTLSATVGNVGERAATGGVTVTFYDGPAALGRVLGVVDIEDDVPVGGSLAAAIDVTAPTHVLDLHVVATASDLDPVTANDAAHAVMPFNPTPRTAATLAGAQGANDWFTQAVTVTLAPFDGSAAPYAATTYRLDGGGPVTYTGPFVVATEGAHVVTFASTDAQGNVETERSVAFNVDLAAPTLSVTNPLAGFIHAAGFRVANPYGFTAVAGVVDVTAQAADSGAGVARLRVDVDGDAVSHGELGSDGQYHVLWDSTRVPNGWHTVTVTAVDGAGRETATSLPVYVLAARSVQVEKDVPAMMQRLDPFGGGA